GARGREHPGRRLLRARQPPRGGLLRGQRRDPAASGAGQRGLAPRAVLERLALSRRRRPRHGPQRGPGSVPAMVVLNRRRELVLAAGALLLLGIACALPGPHSMERHRWWAGLGPVLPHASFPAECSLCHVGAGWNELRADFSFDHAERTGVPLQ